jgi:hypothetical protein
MANCQESFELKRTFWLSVLVLLPGALLPLAVRGQAVPPSAPPSAPKYKAYGGFAYTSLNQVNQSRYGLMGFKASLTRDWGKYFGLRASGDYYKTAVGTGSLGNPGNPSVYSILAGPEIHSNIIANVDGLVFAELGMEHTGGEHMIPATSFAGGFGGGLEWRLNQRWGLEATGDKVLASFSVINNTPLLGQSSHITSNARATIGVTYRF